MPPISQVVFLSSPKRLVQAALWILTCVAVTEATTYYVAPTGDASALDSAGYGTRLSPFATVEYAVDLLDGLGGTVVLLDGVYTNPNFNDGDIWTNEMTIRINNVHGTEANPIIIKGDTPTGHTLKGDGYNIFQLRVSSHVVLEDLNILGEVENIPLQDAWDHRFDYKIDGDNTVYQRVDPALTPAEIEALGNTLDDISNLNVIRPSYYTTNGLLVQSSRYVTVRNCKVGYMPGTGLRIQSSDFVDVENNEVHNSSRRSSVGNHGMVIHSVTNKVDGTTINDDGYRINIIGNTVHDNYNEVYSWSSLKTFIHPEIDEGKGITIQKTDSTFDNGTGRILIANNVVYSNGFSGVHTNYATKVDIYFNTAVSNDASGKGVNIGISVSDSTDCKVINNIAYSTNTFGGKVYSTDSSDLASDQVVFTTNLAVGDIDSVFDTADFIIATAEELDLLGAPEYRVPYSSTAVNAGDDSVLVDVPLDKDGNTRDANPDLGAYELVGEVPTSKPSETSMPSFSPSILPSVFPSLGPSSTPSLKPSSLPSISPSLHPTTSPSETPSYTPSFTPSVTGTNSPSTAPSTTPTSNPSASPSLSNAPTKSSAPSIDLFENLESIQIQIPSKLTLKGVKIPKDPIQLDAVVSTFERSIKASAMVKLRIKRKNGKLRIRVVIKSINGEPVDKIRKKLVSTNVVERRLQQEEEESLIEYDLIVEEICADETTGVCSDTNALATELYNTATESMREQIKSGAFLTQLQTTATTLDIGDFVADISVQASDFVELVEVLVDSLSSFYPDWETTNGYCKNDGNEPLYMVNNPTWKTDTRQECCLKYFSWALNECLGSTAIESDGSSLVWFADWLGSDTCTDDVANAPGYMLKNREGWMFSTKEACCTRFYGWSFAECMGDAYIATGPSGWYIDWINESCVKSCPVSSIDVECGGYGTSWDYIYESASACCQQLHWVPFDECLAN